VLDALKSSPQISAKVNFSYLPVQHILSNGSFDCREQFDCESTHFDTCLARQYCWFGDCSADVQMKLAAFLQCFEGPFANRENPTDPSRRSGCMKSAGLDIEVVNKCVADEALLTQSMVQLNSSKTAMYKRLLPNSGLFPHMFLGGVQLYNFTWAGLLRRICDEIDPGVSRILCLSVRSLSCLSLQALTKPCLKKQLAVELTVDGKMSAAQPALLTSAIEAAVNLVISNISFPVNFFTDDDSLDGAPSYLDVNATLTLQVKNAAGSTIPFSITVLGHFADAFVRAVPTKSFLDYADWALGSIAGMKNVRVVGARVVPFAV
jgi:hypothetical protein